MYVYMYIIYIYDLLYSLHACVASRVTGAICCVRVAHAHGMDRKMKGG